ncbi:hypothetical protein KEJ36_05325 [Candidatus Bathyarchaeota archaeon]|nr:hypothetical protein [Candidatus Bathyarchaeota archaeon]
MKAELENETDGGREGEGKDQKNARLILTPQEVRVQEEDWRGILALIFTVGTIAIGLFELFLFKATVLFERLLPLDAMIIAYYFGSKSSKE